MGIYSTLSASDNLALGGPKPLAHLAIAGLTFCSRAVDLYLSISAPSSYRTHGNTNYIAAAKFVANKVVFVTTKHASLIATTKSSPTIQAARALPIKLSVSTPALPTSSYLGFTVGFLAICALFTVFAGVALLRNISSAVVSRDTSENSSSPSINLASTDHTPALDIPSPRLGRRSGGSGGDEPFSSSHVSDNIANDDNDANQLHTSGRGDPPPPDGPPPPSLPADDPEDDKNHDMDDFWTMILKNMLTGVVVGLLIRGIRAFNRYRYFAAIRRAGKTERESVVAMPGKSLDAAAVFSNRSTSVSLYGMSSVRASLSESVRLCQTTIAIAGLLSLDSTVRKFSSVSVPVVKSVMPSCNTRHGLQNTCSSRPKGASWPMDGALPTETTEPRSIPRRQPTAHISIDHETIESPIQTKAIKDIFNLLIVICGLYLIVAVSLIPALFLTTDSRSSLSNDSFNGAGQDQDTVDASFVALEALPLVLETIPVGEEKTFVSSSQFTTRTRLKREEPEDLTPKEILEEASIDTHDLCNVLDKFMPVHLDAGKVAPNTSLPASLVRPYGEPVPESQDVEQWLLPPVLSEPLELDDDERENKAVKKPNGREDVASTVVPQLPSPVSFESLENVIDGEPSQRPDIDISESTVAKSEDLVAESTTTVLEIANQRIVLASTQRDGRREDVVEPTSAPGEEATLQLEVPVVSQELEDLINEREHVQLERESISTSPLETATEAGVSIDKTPVENTPVDDVLVDDTPADDTSLLPSPPSAVFPPPASPPPLSTPAPFASPTPPVATRPPWSSRPNPSTSSAEAGPSYAASRFYGTEKHRGSSASGIGSKRKSSNGGYDPFDLSSTFMVAKASRRGKRGNKKKPSSSTGGDHSESTGTSHLPDVDAGGLHSQRTEIQDNENVSVCEGERPESDAPLAAPEPVGVRNKTKGKEKDPSEYPTAGSSITAASCPYTPLSGTVNGTPSEDQMQSTQGSDDSFPPIARPSAASPHHGPDLVVNDEFTAPPEASSTLAETSTTESSYNTAKTTDGGVQFNPVERQEPQIFYAAGKTGNGKEKETDPSEYPVAGPSNADGARLLRMQTRDQNQNGGSESPRNRNEKKNEPNGMGQQDRDSQSTGFRPSTTTPSPPRAAPIKPSFPAPSTPTRRGGKGKRKENHQRVPQSSAAGPSNTAALPRHGKRRRLEQPAIENLECSQTNVRGSSLLDSIHAPRPALPSNRPPPNPLLHPELAAAIPNASPSGIPLSQLSEPRMLQLDPPTRTATTNQPPQPAPTRVDTPPPPRDQTDLGEPSAPLSPRLPARTLELDYSVEPRRRPVQSRSPSLTPDSRDGLSSSDRSPRRRFSFSNNFRFARQVTVPWDEEAEAGESLEPQRPPSPDRPPSDRLRGTADSRWAPHNTVEF